MDARPHHPDGQDRLTPFWPPPTMAAPWLAIAGDWAAEKCASLNSDLLRSVVRMRKLERQELIWLTAGLAACILLFAFFTLAGQVAEGDTTRLDMRILRALRDPADPAKPIGPHWVELMMLDLTAVGGPTVLSLVVLAIAGFLLLQSRYRMALVVAFTSFGGMLATAVLKEIFARPRPTVVPHLREVSSSSFPSGHAMQSAIVYLTLGAMLMRIVEGRLTKMYVLAIAVFLTLLVGCSRVYLGVHYPTDVIGGWIIGFVWALLCWLAAQWWEARTDLDKEKGKALK
jgi:undecaprenyl-diphosphatase